VGYKGNVKGNSNKKKGERQTHVACRALYLFDSRSQCSMLRQRKRVKSRRRAVHIKTDHDSRTAKERKEEVEEEEEGRRIKEGGETYPSEMRCLFIVSPFISFCSVPSISKETSSLGLGIGRSRRSICGGKGKRERKKQKTTLLYHLLQQATNPSIHPDDAGPSSAHTCNPP